MVDAVVVVLEHQAFRIFQHLYCRWKSTFLGASLMGTFPSKQRLFRGGYTCLVDDGVYRTLRTSTVGVTESHVMEREPG